MLELSPLVTAAERAGLLDAGLAEEVAVEADALDGAPDEALGQPPERLGLLVDDGDRVATVLEDAGQARNRPARIPPPRRATFAPLPRGCAAGPGRRSYGRARAGQQPAAAPATAGPQQVADLGEQHGLVARRRRVLGGLARARRSASTCIGFTTTKKITAATSTKLMAALITRP